jgi:hypothetical protein
MLEIIKAPKSAINPLGTHIAYMFVCYMRAPARPTREEVKRGAVTDLGEIGTVPEAHTWSRETPHSPAQRRVL